MEHRPTVRAAKGTAGTQINVLQAGRAVAALAVVVYHSVASAGTFSGDLPGRIATAGSYGYLGVDFFFVLSGFIIYHVNSGREHGLAWVRRYSWSRLTRVFLPYLPVGILLGVAYSALPSLSAGNRHWNWFSTLTLLPSSSDPSLIVAWTLTHELIFYGLFALAFLSRRPFLWLGLWVVAIAVWSAGGPVGRIEDFFLGPINLEFALGVATAWIVERGWRLPVLVPGLLAGGAYVALGAREEQRVLFGVAVAFLLVGLVKAEQSHRFTVPRSLVILGNASYAIYLVHNPLGALFSRAVDPWALSLFGSCAVGVAAGLAYHYLWERPVLRVAGSGGRQPRTAEALTPP